MDDYNIGLAQIGALVYIVDRKICYEVAEVTNDCDANEITLNGYSLNNMLDRRVVANETNIKTVADIYSMMQSGEPGLMNRSAGGEEILDEEGLKKLMMSPKYWKEQDPATLKKVSDGFRRLYPGTQS